MTKDTTREGSKHYNTCVKSVRRSYPTWMVTTGRRCVCRVGLTIPLLQPPPPELATTA